MMLARLQITIPAATVAMWKNCSEWSWKLGEKVMVHGIEAAQQNILFYSVKGVGISGNLIRSLDTARCRAFSGGSERPIA